MDLTDIYKTSNLSINYLRRTQYVDITKYTKANEAQAKPFKTFEMDISIPIAINEL